MKASITIRIDAELLREARILAAEENSSVNALVANRLERAVWKRREFREACERAKARLRAGFDLGFTPPKSRDEIYER